MPSASNDGRLHSYRGAYPYWVRRLTVAVDAQRVVGEGGWGGEERRGQREQRRGGGAPQRGRGVRDRPSRGSGHRAGTSAVSGAATGMETPAMKSAVAAKRHVAPASSEIRTMRWWNRRNGRVAGGSRREK